jgi:hypothetical protein
MALAWQCPYNETSMPFCTECPYKAPSWQALATHLKTKHDIPKASIDGTYLALMASNKHRGELSDTDQRWW